MRLPHKIIPPLALLGVWFAPSESRAQSLKDIKTAYAITACSDQTLQLALGDSSYQRIPYLSWLGMALSLDEFHDHVVNGTHMPFPWLAASGAAITAATTAAGGTLTLTGVGSLVALPFVLTEAALANFVAVVNTDAVSAQIDAYCAARLGGALARIIHACEREEATVPLPVC
jgi:hypothetical protein